MVFDSAAARDTALATVKAELMVALLRDLNTRTTYSGAAWSTEGPVYGPGNPWTPTVTQLGAVTVTNTSSTWWRWGRMVTCRFQLAVTGTGTVGNVVVIGGLPFTAAHTFGVVGGGYLADVSASSTHPVLVALASSTTLSLLTTTASGSELRLGLVIFTAAFAAGDVLTGTFTYEAAADA